VRQSLLEDNVPRNKDTFGSNILDFVVAMPSRITQESTFNAPMVQLRTPRNQDSIHCGNLGPTLHAKNTEVGNILAFSRERLEGDPSRVTTRGNEIAGINGEGCGFSPVRVGKPRVVK